MQLWMEINKIIKIMKWRRHDVIKGKSGVTLFFPHHAVNFEILEEKNGPLMDL